MYVGGWRWSLLDVACQLALRDDVVCSKELHTVLGSALHAHPAEVSGETLLRALATPAVGRCHETSKSSIARIMVCLQLGLYDEASLVVMLATWSLLSTTHPVS